MNLLHETAQAIGDSGHTWGDVIYIGSNPHNGPPFYRCTVQEFGELADFEYDQGFGVAEIATDLIILFSDGIYMVRRNYDGFEWWEYNPPLTDLPDSARPIQKLAGDGWNTLCELNRQ